VSSNGGSQRNDGVRRRIALGFSLAWGPGLLVAIVVYLITRSVPLGVLGFAVVTALTAIVLGAVGSRAMQRRQQRGPK
jgi:Flp pilus assembly protein TadB